MIYRVGFSGTPKYFGQAIKDIPFPHRIETGEGNTIELIVASDMSRDDMTSLKEALIDGYDVQEVVFYRQVNQDLLARF